MLFQEVIDVFLTPSVCGQRFVESLGIESIVVVIRPKCVCEK